MYNQIIFYIAAAFIILFSILTIKFENIFYSLLSAIVVFWMASVIFLLAGSEYNAIVQLAVYGFAIPVILGITVMFTTFKKKKEPKPVNINKNYLLFLLCGMLLISITYIVMISMVSNPDGFNIIEEHAVSGNSLGLFAEGIFKKYVWGFELVSVLITIIAAGLTIFKKEVKNL